MFPGANLLTSALNSNVGQDLVNAGAEKAAEEIFGRDGFGGEEVNSPTAKVEAPAPAPMNTAPTAAKKPIPKWMIKTGIGIAVVAGIFLLRGKKGKGKGKK